MLTPVIHRRATAGERRSTKRRPQHERDLLEHHGRRIVIVELRGSLFFGTTNRLLDELSSDLDRPLWLILHLRRVRDVDLTAVRLLAQIASRINAAGGELLFCNVHKEIGLGRKVQKTLRKATFGAAPQVKTFVGSDEALEYAEDGLLEELRGRPTLPEEAVELCDSELFQKFAPVDFEAVVARLQRKTFQAGEHLFERGAQGERLYVLRRGEVDLVIPTTLRHHKRVAKCGPGMHFGEIAFLETGPRSATAIARTSVEVYELSQESFRQMRTQTPSAALALLEALALTQVNYVRWSAAEIERLAQW
jgi:anti-anti-sigma regulatory factor